MKNVWMILSALLFASLAQAQTAATGTLQVNGQAGKFQLFQKVKVVRCDTAQRTCDNPVYFGLNQAQAVAAGTYIVGFENSINPNLVTVNEGQATTLVLDRVSVPSSVKGQKIRVYRDFGNSMEQNKILMTMFYMKHHFFRLDKNNFGDLYLTGSWERDFVQRFSYETCAAISTYGFTQVEANNGKSMCAVWNNAKSPQDIAGIYEFKNDGTFVENWVSFPGDVIPSNHPRYLVSAPMTEQDFVAVFPGVYKVQAEGKNTPAVSVRSGGGLF